MTRPACLLAPLLFVFTGCASVVSSGRYDVVMDNPPAPTHFTVFDRKDQPIATGVTPDRVELNAKSYPFWPAKYSVVFAGQAGATQRQEVKAGFDPWILGNIVLGGGAGAIVDGATGAAFQLPERVTGSVPPQFAVQDPVLGTRLAQESKVPAEVRTVGHVTE